MSRLRSILVWLMMAGCMGKAAAGAILSNILIPITSEIPTTNINDFWVLCGVPAASCHAGAPLTITDAAEPYDINSYPPTSEISVIYRVDLNVLESGYITFLGVDSTAPDHVVIGLRSGIVNAGDPWPFATSETQLAADILTGDALALARLRTFFNSNLSAFPTIDGDGQGSGGILYRFSDATVVGSIGPISAATPEPAAGVLMAGGLLGLASISRVRKFLRRSSAR